MCNSRLISFSLTLCLCLAVNAEAAALSDSPRVLPIRGEALLEALRTTPLPPMPRQVSVSPDGSKLLVAEALYWPPYGVGYATHLTEDVEWTIWLYDTASGRRFALSTDEDLIDSTRVGKLVEARWSADSRQVALLSQSSEEFTLLVFETAGMAQPQRFALPPTSIKGGAKETVVDWYWDAARNEVVLGLEVGKPGYQKPSIPQESEEITWTWILSRDLKSGLRDAVPGRPIRLVVVNLSTRQIREVVPASDDTRVGLRRERGPDPFFTGPANWSFNKNGRQILLRMRDPAVEDLDDSHLQWLIYTGDARSKEFASARSSVHDLDISTGQVRRLFQRGAGQIGGIVPDADGRSFAIVESTPATANWPMYGQWGEVRWVDRVSGRSEGAAVAVVPLDAKLFASERPGVLYTHHPRTLTLTEITRAPARQVDLMLPNLSVSHADVSADGRTIAAVMEGANTPPAVYLWQSSTREWRPLTDESPQWRNPAQITIEHHTWPSRDGVFETDGFLIKPPNFDARKKYPMLVLLKGGNATRTIRYVNRFDPMFGGARAVGGPPGAIYADAGYLVLMPNHRGSEYSGVTANRAFVGQYGRHVELDVLAGVDMLIEKGWVDPDRLGVIGHSHGGDEAYYAITHTQRFKAALINDSPVMMPEFYIPEVESISSSLIPWYGANTMTHFFGFDPVRQPWADPFSIRTPLLLRWAARNGNNPPGKIHLTEGWAYMSEAAPQTHKLIYALRSNGVPIEVVIDQDDHQVENSQYMLEWQSRLLQWFDYFLLGKGENPIPAAVSPFDYTDALNQIKEKLQQ